MKPSTPTLLCLMALLSLTTGNFVTDKLDQSNLHKTTNQKSLLSGLSVKKPPQTTLVAGLSIKKPPQNILIAGLSVKKPPYV